MAETNLAQALLTETDVSKQLRVSLAALRKWCVVNRWPQFLKVGSLVRYRQDDIDDWLKSLHVGGGGQRTPADRSKRIDVEFPIGGESDAARSPPPEVAYD